MAWKKIKLGEILHHRKQFITIDDSIEYKRCRVQVNRKGVVLRDIIKGLAINTKKQQICKSGDFLVAEIDAKVGGYGFINNELEGAIVSSHYFLFEIKKEKILPAYFAQLIKTDIIQNQINSRGSTNYAAIRPAQFLSFEMMLPSLKEQQAIVGKISTLGKVYTPFQEEISLQIANLKVLRRSILQEAIQGKLVPQDSNDEPASILLKRMKEEKLQMIDAGLLKKEKPFASIEATERPFELSEGWEWCRLGNITRINSGVTLGKSYKDELIKVPYLRVANVQRGWIDIAEIKELNVPQAEIEKYQLRKGDLLMIEGGDWDKVGRCAIWDKEIEPFIHQNHIYCIRSMEGVSNEYLEKYLNSPIARRYFESCSKQTTNLASINKTQLSNTLVPLPPVDVQHRIVSKVN